MDADQIINMLFENHKDFINPKTIARNQISRLVDRVLAKAAPHLRRPVSQASNHASLLDDKENSGLQLNNNVQTGLTANAKKNPLAPVSSAVPADKDQRLELAPDSERSANLDQP